MSITLSGERAGGEYEVKTAWFNINRRCILFLKKRKKERE